MTSSNRNNLTFPHFLFLWFGGAVSIAEIMTGGLIAPLGFRDGIIAILLGHFLGTTLLVLGGIVGTETRLPALTSTRISFGRYGSYLFSGLNVLQLIGWTAVMIATGASSVNQIAKLLWGIDQTALWSVAIGFCIFLWIILGKDSGWKKLNMAAVALLFALTVVLSLTVFADAQIFTKTGSGEMTFGGAVELSVVMPLSWLPLIADYTRFAKTKSGAAAGSWLGYFLGSCWMYSIGLGAAILGGDADPAVMMAANLGLSALGIIVLATVTTTFMDAYSAGVSLVNIVPYLNEKRIAAAMAVIGTVLALVIDMTEYENFLYAIGSVFAPLFAILLTDYFGFKAKALEAELLVNGGAVVVWLAGVALYYQFIKYDFVLGATIPVMALTSALYAISRRCAWKWKSSKKLAQTF